ncbi:hypothetical protein Scep_008698 [Stephania cephalantha]|uniref:Uncharacterized protein n=1 Tax=Stephania cephalantha TaxID=152367 RepID=A0AAP0JRS8_9MAGN
MHLRMGRNAQSRAKIWEVENAHHEDDQAATEIRDAAGRVGDQDVATAGRMRGRHVAGTGGQGSSHELTENLAERTSTCLEDNQEQLKMGDLCVSEYYVTSIAPHHQINYVVRISRQILWGISVLKKCAQNPKKRIESDMTDDNADVGVKASGLAPRSEKSVLDCSLGAKVPGMAPSRALRGQVGRHGTGVSAMVRRPLDWVPRWFSGAKAPWRALGAPGGALGRQVGHWGIGLAP